MIWIIGPLFIALLVSVATAAVLVVLVNINFSSKRGQRLDKVLASYARVVGAGEAAELAADAPKQVRFLFWKKFTRDIDEKLAGAGLEYTSQSWITGSLAASVLVFGLASAFFGNLLIGLIMAGIVGFYLLNAFLSARVKARAVKFATNCLRYYRSWQAVCVPV
jgi:Flp pilus assembly protein TadB